MKHRPTYRFVRALLVAATIVPLAGCALQSEQPDSRDANATTATTNGEQTFTSAEYGFRVRYPADLTLRQQPEPAYLLSDHWKLYANIDAAPGQPVVALRLPTSNKVTSAALRIGVSRDPVSLRSCTNTPAATIPNSAGTTRIDGVTFTTFRARDAGMSHYLSVHGYRAVRDDTCYALDLVVYGTNPKVYDPPRTPPFTREQAFAQLQPVATDLEFIPPTTDAQ